MRLLRAIALTLPLACQALSAQPAQPVSLRAFESEAAAQDFMARQGRNRLADIREYHANLAPLADRGGLTDEGLVAESSSRQLVMSDIAGQPLRLGGAVQRVGERLFVLRRGRLALVQLANGRPTVSARIATRIYSIDWPNEWGDELNAWGNVAATLAHGDGSVVPVLRTFVATDDGALTPRDTLIISGIPPTRQSNIATRMLGSHLFIYSAWPITSDLIETLSQLVPLSPSTEDGETRYDDVPVMTPLRRVYRPVDVFDTSAVLGVVHALIDCDLATTQLACETTLVLAPDTRRFTFTNSALEIVSATKGMGSDSALFVRIPYAGSTPTAFLSADQPSAERTKRVGPYEITPDRTRTNDDEGVLVHSGDTVTIVRRESAQTWRVALPHHVTRMVELGSDVLLVGAGKAVVYASLLHLGSTPRVVQQLTLPDASEDSGNAVLTVHQLDASTSTHFRIGYTVVDPTADHEDDSARAHHAAWFFDVNEGSLSNLGVLRATPAPFTEDADWDEFIQRLGAAQTVIVGDRVFAVFNEELVEGQLVNGRVVELWRTALFPN